MKSKATGCGSISTVFSSIVLLCVSIIIIIIIIIIIMIIILIIIITIIIMIIIIAYTVKSFTKICQNSCIELFTISSNFYFFCNDE